MPSLGNPGRVGAVLALLLVTGLPLSSARAAGGASPDRLRDLETEANSLQSRSEEIRRNFTERSGLIGVQEARDRYEDAVYLFLIEDYENAATSFYILVQSRALGNADLARDSEWYLAECLFELENYRTAEEAYRSIIEKGPQHPYFPDAVRRALEIYGILGDTEQFDRYYNDFILTGKVKATELINYTLAKSFYRRGESNRAKSMFDSLPPTSSYYTRARYFMGVLMIQEKNNAQAIEEFKKVVAVTPSDPGQAQVLELSQLALARLYYETGNFAEASNWYGKISGDSPYYADQLYESVWTLIKQQSWPEALAQVDTFLTHFPEHRYSASLKLLRGHLYMKTKGYEDARTSYEQVVDEYTPLIDRIDSVSGPDQLRRLLEGITGGESGVSERLPGYAVGVLLNDEKVARATDAWREVADEKEELVRSERTVRDLEAALSGSTNVLGGFLAARQQITGIRGNVLSLQDRLLDNEATWLKTRVPSQYRADLAQIQKERAAVLTSVTAIGTSAGQSSDKEQVYDEQVREVQNRATRVFQEAVEVKKFAASTMEEVGQHKLPLAEQDKVRAQIVQEQKALDEVLGQLDSLSGEVTRKQVMRSVQSGATTEDEARRATILSKYEDIRRRLATYRAYVTDADAAAQFAQIDRVWTVVGGLDRSTDDTSAVLTNAEGREMSAVRTRLARESQRVVELRRDVDTEGVESETVAMRALRGGLYDLGDQFKADVLEADKGIVDVYWLRKTAASDEMSSLGEEQARLLRELDDQFRIVRENLDR